METTHIKSSPKDVFLYLFAMIALYISAFSLIRLFFEFINTLIPDVLSYMDPGSSIRWPLSLLVILFPAYLWASRFLHRDIVKSPEKANLRARRWFVYFTLFLSALLMIGDLVALIYNFLGGDLTGQFILKVVAILLVAGAVFGYYLYDLRKKTGTFSNQAKMFVWIAIIGVLASIVGGFFVAGSPFKQRLVRFDSQKVTDLQTIQWQVVNYWQSKQKLPQSLEDLKDPISGFNSPKDPQSGDAYKYRAMAPLTFELCAEFNLSSKDMALYIPTYARPEFKGGIEDNWEHEVGRGCFTRTIDPDIYPPTPKPITK